jgi:hypothetical protein
MKKLTANNLKQVLWATLNGLKSNRISAKQGAAIASQAREIINTTKTQLMIAEKSKKEIAKEVIQFANSQ